MTVTSLKAPLTSYSSTPVKLPGESGKYDHCSQTGSRVTATII